MKSFNDVLEIADRLEDIKNSISFKYEIPMYKVCLKEYKTTIPCAYCLAYGEVRGSCLKCGGKGIHRKTKKRWEICKRFEMVELIDIDNCDKHRQDSPTYDIRYWTSSSEFFFYQSRYLFFDKASAITECNIRNSIKG